MVDRYIIRVRGRYIEANQLKAKLGYTFSANKRYRIQLKYIKGTRYRVQLKHIALHLGKGFLTCSLIGPRCIVYLWLAERVYSSSRYTLLCLLKLAARFFQSLSSTDLFST